MKILVCIKQILDPEVSARDFQINRQRLEAEPTSANWVTNIFCENALESALQLREKNGEGTVTAICLGQTNAEDSLRKALAMKVDEAFLVVNDGHPHPDSAATAQVLAAAIKKLSSFDLIMTGREAGDWGAGQVGGLLAEALDLPCISFVDEISTTDDGFQVRRQTDIGWERYETSKPLLITVTNNDQNLPRIPKTRDIMMSSRKPITKWSLEDLGLSTASVASESAAVQVVDLFIPEKKNECEFVDGDSIQEKMDGFARKIAEVVQAV